MTTAADTPGAVRGIRRADVRIIENDGRQLWVDVKVISTKPKVAIKNALCQAEVAKCKQYGQGPPERSELHGKMILFVAEAHGKLAPMAETLPREARDLISKIRSCTVRSDLKNKPKTAENALFLRSGLTVQDRILEIRSLASLGNLLPHHPPGEGDWGKKGRYSQRCSAPGVGAVLGTPFMPSSHGWMAGVSSLRQGPGCCRLSDTAANATGRQPGWTCASFGWSHGRLPGSSCHGIFLRVARPHGVQSACTVSEPARS